MFAKFKERKDLEMQWMWFLKRLLVIENQRLNEIVDVFAFTFSASLMLYAHENRINKNTLRYLNIIKRVLADKRKFEMIKCIDYLLAGHSISQFKIDEEIRERSIAHMWQMGNSYLQMVLRGQQSNPFAAGEILKQVERKIGEIDGTE